MADTIREKILDHVETTMNLIKTSGGYANTIASVQKYKQAGNEYASTPCIIILAGQENLEKQAGFFTRAKFSILLGLVTIAPTDTDATLNSLLGDIQKALMIDYTRGGIAENTTIQNIVPYETVEGNSYAGLIITVEIQYVFKTSDPTSQV